ncbi:hypothetical protein [Kutzneria sp. NPDC051319]|uniref:hypothetical protein n=1 Tax=Kutzneria sp. NPDC051319 TaxID=3155047 RepID=UPI00341ABA7E
MTFRHGFVLVSHDFLNNEQIVDAVGQAAQGEELGNVEPETRVELDEAFVNRNFARIRLAGAQGVFHVGEVYKDSVQDLRPAYARRRIAELDRQRTVDHMPTIAEHWRAEGTRFWWRVDPPAGLAVEQVVKVTVVADDAFTVQSDEGRSAVVRFDAMDLDTIDFVQSAGELDERRAGLDSRKGERVLTPREAVAKLAESPLIQPFTTEPPPITIAVAASDDDFEMACVKYLVQTPQFLNDVPAALGHTAMVNGFTDTVDEVRTILLRPGAQGVGTEVHETVHALGSDAFARRAVNFFNEGLTEYFTRKVVAKEVRGDRYEYNTDFVTELVASGATTDDVLVRLYFTGDWAGFRAALYAAAGDLLAIDVLLAAGLSDHSSTIDYLNELIQNPDPQLT